MTVFDYNVDVVIIGAGSAGLVARRAAERSGATTLLCDGGTLGTTCARVGCMPSKLLVAPARSARAARRAPQFGVNVDAPSIDGKAVMQRVQSERDRFVGFVVRDIDKMREGGLFLPENVHFVEPGVMKSTSGKTIRYKSAVIAAGTTPFVPPPFDQLQKTLLTSDTVFEIEDIPKRFAVVGAGVIGLELGQAMAALDSDVTVFDTTDNLSFITDPEVHESFAEALRNDVRLFQNSSVSEAKESDQGATLRWKDSDGKEHEDTFDYVLVAAGRRSSFDSLNLQAVGIEESNATELDIDPERLQVGDDSGIFMAGDINIIRPLLHEAAGEGRIAGENAAKYAKGGAQAVCFYDRQVPLSIAFTFPETVTGGKTWSEVSKDGEVLGDKAVGFVSFENQGRSRVDLLNHGVLRVYGDQETKQLIGFEMCGPSAEHVAHLLTWAIQQELTVSTILTMPFYHPVIEEGVRTALQRLAKALGLKNESRMRCQEVSPVTEREDHHYQT